MAENKRSFVAYVDWKETFDALPDEKAGQLVKHLFAYVNDENPKTDDVLINAVFANIKHQLKRDLKKWESLSDQRAEIGRIGGIKSGEARRKQSEANEAIALNTKQNEHDICNMLDVNANDINRIIDIYNNTSFSKLQKLTSTREKHLKARLKEYGIEKVTEVFYEASKSDFLTGRNNHNWKANFDWIINPQNFVKIMEGNYINKKKQLVV